jgi:tripartite-type tricarboxylate transporter receptor subunit TctC
VALLSLCSMANGALAQTFPTRPVRLLTGGAGGGNDIAARLIAEGLSARLGQQVIVENRPSGFIPGETVAKAKPDGYTIVLSGRSHWMAPLSVDKAPYDPLEDFAAITLPVTTPNVLAVHPSLPVKSVKDLIALAKARPGELNYGASGQGSGPHLAGALFNRMAGVKIVRINYRGMGAVYTDLMSGQVHIAFGSAPGVMPLVQAGRLRGIAVTSATPSPLAAGLPTIAATGLPGYDFTSPFGVFAPAGTPRAIVTRLNEEILRVLASADAKERFFKAGMEIVGSTPEELDKLVRTEVKELGSMMKEQGS